MLPIPVVFIVRLPDTGTVPKPAMLAEVAFRVFQFNVVEPPNATLLGLAVKDSMVGSGTEAGGGGNAPVTTTIVEAEVEFMPFVAAST
jgi:hypothetical protein